MPLRVSSILILVSMLFGCSTVHKNGMYQTKRYKLGKPQHFSLKKSILPINSIEKDTLTLANKENLTELYCATENSNPLIIVNSYEPESSEIKTFEVLDTAQIFIPILQPLDTLPKNPLNKDKPKLEDTFWYGFGLITIGTALYFLSTTGALGLFGLIAFFLGLALVIYGLVELISFLVRLSRANKREKKTPNSPDTKIDPKKRTIWNAKFITGIIFTSIGLLSAFCVLSTLATPITTSTILALFQLLVLFGCIAAAITFLILGIAMLAIGISQYSENP